MTEQLKPVGKIYLITDRPECEWYQSVSEGDLLYAIPSTRRVVSVELLEKAINVIAWTEHPIVSQLRAIIDGNQTEREDI